MSMYFICAGMCIGPSLRIHCVSLGNLDAFDFAAIALLLVFMLEGEPGSVKSRGDAQRRCPRL
jgi:hypothetical protein